MHLAKPVEIDVLLEAVVELFEALGFRSCARRGGSARASAARKDLDEADAFYSSPKLAAVDAVPFAD